MGLKNIDITLKSLLTIITFILFAQTAIAQTSTKKLKAKADELFESEQYFEAQQHYRTLLENGKKTLSIKLNLGTCYRATFDYRNALGVYQNIYLENAKQYPLATYYYALMLKQNAKYDESFKIFEEFIATEKEASKEILEFIRLAKTEIEGVKLAIFEKEKGMSSASRTEKSKHNINSKYHDYASWETKEEKSIIVTSSRVDDSNKENANRFGENFSKLYVNQIKEEAQSNEANYSFDMEAFGTISMNASETKMYMTGCGKLENCAIYYSELIDVNAKKTWTKPVVLNKNINQAGTENKHPHISTSGDTLFFVSTREGGLGNFDIWMSTRSKKGKENWLKPINLGAGVNTPLNEYSPYLYDSVLSFSSNGHVSYGGYDVYISNLNNRPLDAVNIGSFYNSPSDDCFLNFGNTDAYVSSNKKDGEGGFDIYSFDKNEFLKEMETRYDDYLKSKKGGFSKVEALMHRGLQEMYATLLERYEEWKDGKSKLFRLKIAEKDFLAELRRLTRSSGIFSNDILFSSGTSRVNDRYRKDLIKAGKFIKENGITLIVEGHTDSQGNEEYNQKLSERRAESVSRILSETESSIHTSDRSIRESRLHNENLELKSFGESAPISSNETQEGRKRNRRVKLSIKKVLKP